ncbi:TetR family transcriptional regulator [Nonomuraea polychroma]|uniref:TetR family transcriptional regulator n=1 Tax=Nonomuraea polychroma TaxID=46176 RepID=A0A438M867_9ACTN|nr:TetR/AcrR family transcriptional regulator [Nonomuraea polychroma]RVX41886.1 TetR family transcriptional regulator [Nonomuraea polychroma]
MSTPPTRRKPRIDAERNRDRVLEAARALFAEQGYDVQMTEVAKVAGVGVGTLYRKFPTREALIEAVAERRSAEMAAFARARCLAEADPFQALRVFLCHVGEVLADDRGMSEVIEKAMGSTEPRGETRAALLAVIAELIHRAQAGGVIRSDVTTEDVNMIVCGMAAVIRHSAGDWQRLVEIALDGLRPR